MGDEVIEKFENVGRSLMGTDFGTDEDSLALRQTRDLSRFLVEKNEIEDSDEDINDLDNPESKESKRIAVGLNLVEHSNAEFSKMRDWDECTSVAGSENMNKISSANITALSPDSSAETVVIPREDDIDFRSKYHSIQASIEPRVESEITFSILDNNGDYHHKETNIDAGTQKSSYISDSSQKILPLTSYSSENLQPSPKKFLSLSQDSFLNSKDSNLLLEKEVPNSQESLHIDPILTPPAPYTREISSGVNLIRPQQENFKLSYQVLPEPTESENPSNFTTESKNSESPENSRQHDNQFENEKTSDFVIETTDELIKTQLLVKNNGLTSAPKESAFKRIEPERASYNPNIWKSDHKSLDANTKIDLKPKPKLQTSEYPIISKPINSISQTHNKERSPSIPIPISERLLKRKEGTSHSNEHSSRIDPSIPQSKEILVAELKAMKIRQASISARNAALQAEIASTRTRLEEVTRELKTPAAETVKRHIKLLHDYNDIRDVGQGLIGMIAEQRGVRVGSLYGEFGVDAKD